MKNTLKLCVVKLRQLTDKLNTLAALYQYIKLVRVVLNCYMASHTIL